MVLRWWRLCSSKSPDSKSTGSKDTEEKDSLRNAAPEVKLGAGWGIIRGAATGDKSVA